MIIPDRKKALSVILGKIDGGAIKDGPSVMPEENEAHPELHAIAQDLIAGIKKDSAMEIATALKAFWDMVKADDAEQDAEE